MRKISAFLLIAILGLATSISCSFASEEIVESSLAKRHLDNLRSMLKSGGGGIGTKDYHEKLWIGKITGDIETSHALIYAYDGAEVPDFLADNVDRIFQTIVDYLNLEDKDDKIVVWVMDFDTIVHIPHELYSIPHEMGQEGSFYSHSTFSALYAPLFNYLFFSPEHINDYYVTHELLHYFVDEYEKEVTAGLSDEIRRKYATHVLAPNFLKQKEEEIVTELAQIIVRKSLASAILDPFEKAPQSTTP